MTKMLAPFLEFNRTEWQRFRKDTPMTLTEGDLAYLHGQIEEVSLSEIETIYLSLSRLLNLYVVATQDLYTVTSKFLDHPEAKVPYIIGVAGSVAVGKSTTSRILRALLSRWPNHPHVEIVTTDGYLFPNHVLEERGLMERKGFPESYDLHRLVEFLADLKSGKKDLRVPIYSHHNYDIIADKFSIIDQPDIVIVEGLNVLQVGTHKAQQNPRVFVSDYFDFAIYVNADTDVIKDWFLSRFKLFREKAKNDKDAFFYQFTKMTVEDAMNCASDVWKNINECNLFENILPYRMRSQLILHKGVDHAVEMVYLRKL